MSDVDQVQNAEEARIQREEEAKLKEQAAQDKELAQEPFKLTARAPRSHRDIPLDQIHSAENIRTDLPEIQELAISIVESGLLTPLVVRPWNDEVEEDGKLPHSADPEKDNYRLIAGHRRHAALRRIQEQAERAEAAGEDVPVERQIEAISCEVFEQIDHAQVVAMMLIENTQRVELPPLQTARALRYLIGLNEGSTAASVARSVGMRPQRAQEYLRMLDLPGEILDMMEKGDLSFTSAELIRRGESKGRIDKDEAVELAKKVAAGDLTKKDLRDKVAPAKPNTPEPKTVRVDDDGNVIVEKGSDWKETDRDDKGKKEKYEPWKVDFDKMAPASMPMPGQKHTLTEDGMTVSVIPPEHAGSDGGGIDIADLVRQGPGAQGPLNRPQDVEDVQVVRVAPAGAETNMAVELNAALDGYLLGRLLQEMAPEEYLAELELAADDIDAWVDQLTGPERLTQLRHLALTLRDSGREGDDEDVDDDAEDEGVGSEEE